MPSSAPRCTTMPVDSLLIFHSSSSAPASPWTSVSHSHCCRHSFRASTRTPNQDRRPSARFALPDHAFVDLCMPSASESAILEDDMVTSTPNDVLASSGVFDSPAAEASVRSARARPQLQAVQTVTPARQGSDASERGLSKQLKEAQSKCNAGRVDSPPIALQDPHTRGCTGEERQAGQGAVAKGSQRSVETEY